MNLIDRLERAGHPIRERHGLPPSPGQQVVASSPPAAPAKPEWLRRKDQGQLPAKELLP